MNRASVDIAGCDTHAGWTEDDDCPYCVIAAKDARIALMEKVVEAARMVHGAIKKYEDLTPFGVQDANFILERALRAYDAKVK